MMRPLDVRTVPLRGLQLIEASAGTGKTWTIAALYVRLLLSLPLGVEDIVVLTFTKAATAELRSRIRERINGVRRALLEGDSEEDFCRWILQTWQGEARDEALRRLELARRGFDQAGIFTIHGFCQRALAELQVPALLNEPDVVADEAALLPGLLAEAWVRLCDSATLASLPDAFGLKPDTVLADLQTLLRKPYMRLAGEASLVATEAVREQWSVLRRFWEADREAIVRDVLEADINRGGMFRGLEDSLGWLGEALARPEPEVLACFLELVPAQFEASRNKRKKAPILPSHHFWGQMEHFRELAAGRVDRFRRALIDDVRQALAARKQDAGQISYQDLLLMLQERVGDGRVAATLRQRYPAALVDEFQDTDPLQFDIFRRVYGGFEQPVFFVGDPKQAIYSFRGADIFTYIEARQTTGEQHTLLTNRRSLPGLVRAVNALFSHNDNPFLLRGLEFQPVDAVPAAVDCRLDDELPPLVAWLLPDNEGKPLGKEVARELATAATADRIAALLNAAAKGSATVGERPLAARDIAVLVSTHAQGRQVAGALAQRGIACALRAQDSVFASAEAVAMLRLLEAVAEPGNEGLLKAALLTDCVGCSLAELAAMEADDARWTAATETLLALRERWQLRGFMAMWESLLDHFGVFTRLLALDEGERRLTNLRHLALLMQQKADTEPALQRQLAWLREQYAGGEASEETLLRLESDAERVQVMTIHVSKGLEFPVVFCPFLWDGALLQQREAGRAEYHSGSGTVLDLGSAQFAQAEEAMAGERLAEKVRLLYVALTRARFRCYFGWGPVRDMETAALSWLLLGQGLPAMPHGLKAALKGTDEARCRAALEALAGDDFAWLPLPDAPASYRAPRVKIAVLASLQARRSLHRAWSVSSFTGLTASAHEVEAPDYDATAARELVVEASAPQGIHAFPRGAQAGVFWHEVLELGLKGQRIDRIFIEECLRRHDLDTAWAALVEQHYGVIIGTRLDADGLCLGRLDGAVAEMEFTFRVGQLTLAQLQSLPDVPAAYARALAGLDFARLTGYLKGFIDLICRHEGRYYVIDYKSNWLGPEVAAYGPEAMQRSVAESHYYLQYWLYTLALHRYLRQAKSAYDYERDIGGVRYLYLRGIDGSGQHGVYATKPSRQLIEALDAILEGGA